MTKALTISLVIPVYNEESHLEDCLRSALAQRLPFDEIIVVDNNSTDRTVSIARAFPGVTVISEPFQGVVYARNRGFDEATGDIIARIDADTRLPAGWNTQLLQDFEDATTAAVSGAISYCDISGRRLVDAIDLCIRSWLAKKMPEHLYLLGANMAVRRTAWKEIRSDLCTAAGLHEDLDLSAHLGERGARVLFNPQLLALVSGRRIDTTLPDFISYLRPMPQTYAAHGIREHRYMYPVIAFVLLHYIPLRVLYRGFDAQTGRFSFIRLLKSSPLLARVNPATYVD